MRRTSTRQTKEVYQDMAHNVARLRAARGLTLEELAERSGVPSGELSKIEEGKGKETTITLTTLIRLADALSVEPAEIVAAAGTSTPAADLGPARSTRSADTATPAGARRARRSSV